MRTRKLALVAVTAALTLSLGEATSSARLTSARRSFGPPLRAAMKNVVRPGSGSRLTNRVYLQAVKGGKTLMTVVSQVSGKPVYSPVSGRRMRGASGYFLIDASGQVERLGSWGQLQQLELDSGASTPPATKVYLKPLTNGGAFMSTRGTGGEVRYFYLGKTARVKQLTSWRQAQKVSEWIK